MGRMVVLWGDINCGKTSTLNLLIERLLGIKTSNVLINEHCIVVKTKGRLKYDRVGIATRGDINDHEKENCKFFNGCNLLANDNDIVFFAARCPKDPTKTKTAIVRTLENYATAHGIKRIDWVHKIAYIANSKVAYNLYRLI